MSGQAWFELGSASEILAFFITAVGFYIICLGTTEIEQRLSPVLKSTCYLQRLKWQIGHRFISHVIIEPTQQTRDVNQCCFGVGPPSATLSQHQTNIGQRILSVQYL